MSIHIHIVLVTVLYDLKIYIPFANNNLNAEKINLFDKSNSILRINLPLYFLFYLFLLSIHVAWMKEYVNTQRVMR